MKTAEPKTSSFLLVATMKMERDMLDWLRDYAGRKGVSMASIVTRQLNNLRRRDERAKKQAQRKKKS